MLCASENNTFIFMTVNILLRLIPDAKATAAQRAQSTVINKNIPIDKTVQ